MDELSIKALDACRRQDWTISTAESCTGGMVATALTAIAGSSDVFDRGFVTYSNAAKIQMLSVLGTTLEEFGAASEPTALEMAEGAINASNADIAVSITGIAGPGPSEHKPEGRVCFGLAVKGYETTTQTIDFGPLGRQNVRLESAQFALNMILNAAK